MAPPHDYMPYELLASLSRIRQLITAVPAEDTELLSTLRQLILGPTLSALLLRDEPPETLEIADLLRALRARRDLLPLARELALEFDTGDDAIVELAVDELLAANCAWEHPTEVLERHERPPYDQLFAACERRVESCEDVDTLRAVLEKVGRALRIDREAAERRQRLRRSRKRP